MSHYAELLLSLLLMYLHVSPFILKWAEMELLKLPYVMQLIL